MIIVNVLFFGVMVSLITTSVILLKPMAIDTFKWLLQDDTEVM